MKRRGPTSIGVLHRHDPDEALKILRAAFKDGAGDDKKIAALLGVGIHMVRKYRGMHAELKEIGTKARVRAAREALEGPAK